MAFATKTRFPLDGVGTASLVLGAMGLILSMIPILGLPLSGLGIIFGLVGLLIAFFAKGIGIRWSLAGIALSGLALILGIAIAQTAAGDLMPSPNSNMAQDAGDRPFTPPPAHPRIR